MLSHAHEASRLGPMDDCPQCHGICPETRLSILTCSWLMSGEPFEHQANEHYCSASHHRVLQSVSQCKAAWISRVPCNSMMNRREQGFPHTLITHGAIKRTGEDHYQNVRPSNPTLKGDSSPAHQAPNPEKTAQTAQLLNCPNLIPETSPRNHVTILLEPM